MFSMWFLLRSLKFPHAHGTGQVDDVAIARIEVGYHVAAIALAEAKVSAPSLPVSRSMPTLLSISSSPSVPLRILLRLLPMTVSGDVGEIDGQRLIENLAGRIGGADGD